MKVFRVKTRRIVSGFRLKHVSIFMGCYALCIKRNKRLCRPCLHYSSSKLRSGFWWVLVIYAYCKCYMALLVIVVVDSRWPCCYTRVGTL